LHNFLRAIFSEYLTLRVDYTICGHEQIASPGLRTVTFNIDSISKTRDLPAFTYDIIIEVHMLGFAVDLQQSLRLLNELLVPGGFLLALEVNGNSQAAGGKWMDYVFSPQGSWPGLCLYKRYHRFSQSVWDEQLGRAGFKAVDAKQDRETALLLTMRAQKPSLPVLSASSTDVEQPVVFSFKLSHALDLQKTLLTAASSGESRSIIWMEATMGTFDGAAATGFARSLRQELVSVDIKLVLLDPVWKAESKVAIIQQLSNFPYLEPEVLVDDSGIVLVPRLFSFPPRIPQTFDLSKYWVIEQSGTAVQPALPLPSPCEVVIEISFVSNAESGLVGVVGTISRTGSSKWTVGTRVVAIAQFVLSNFVVVHEGQIAELPEDCDDGKSSNLALPLIFVALALRLDSLGPPESLQGIQVIVLQTSKIANDIVQVLQHLGLTSHLVSPSLPLTLPHLSPGDVIMCGVSGASARAMPSYSGVSLFNWNDTTHGALPAVTQCPWFVGNILKTHLASAFPRVTVDKVSFTPEQQLPSNFEVSPTIALSPDKFYLIVGGIGSLGVQIAIWMYRVRGMSVGSQVDADIEYRKVLGISSSPLEGVPADLMVPNIERCVMQLTISSAFQI
jgi:hypothetical protein